MRATSPFKDVEKGASSANNNNNNASAQLEFQQFDFKSANDPKNFSSVPAGPQVGQGQQQQQVPVPPKSFWHLEYYAKYFNVDTGDVRSRVIKSIFPKSNFFDDIRENPDLYGPFWIPTTVIFVLFVSGSIAHYLKSQGGASFNITKLTIAAAIIYGYTFVIPLIWWGIFKWWNVKIPILHLLSIYGYGISILVPMAVLSIINIQLVIWVVVGVAFFSSGIFLVRNLIPELKQNETHAAKSGIITLVILGLHLALLISCQLYFFNVQGESGNPGNNPTPTLTPTPTPS